METVRLFRSHRPLCPAPRPDANGVPAADRAPAFHGPLGIEVATPGPAAKSPPRRGLAFRAGGA
jgi:hypothetical protein